MTPSACQTLNPPVHTILKNGRNRCLLPILAVLWVPSSQADCIHQAAAYHGVNAEILRAIGWHESRLKPEAIGRNRNGSIDIGAFQINSIHLTDLARYGIDSQSLTNGCVSAYVGAWHYKKQINQYGNTWFAVGAYHSRTPARAAWYANQVAKHLMAWKIIPQGALPYPLGETLAPGQSFSGRSHEVHTSIQAR